MTRKQKWTYGAIVAIAIAAYFLLRGKGTNVATAPPDYLNSNVPSGYDGQTAFGPLAGLPGLTINPGSCGCSAGNGLSNSFYSSVNQLLSTYNSTVGSVVQSAIDRLSQAASGLYVSPAAAALSTSSQAVL